jgi:hypothetical protein
VTAAVLAYQLAPTIGWGGPAASWPIALALLTLTILALRIVTLLDYLRFTAPAPARDILITAAVIEGGVTLLVAAPLAVRAARTLRTLPSATNPAAPSATPPET